jgi:hypothetical protein
MLSSVSFCLEKVSVRGENSTGYLIGFSVNLNKDYVLVYTRERSMFQFTILDHELFLSPYMAWPLGTEYTIFSF